MHGAPPTLCTRSTIQSHCLPFSGICIVFPSFLSPRPFSFSSWRRNPRTSRRTSPLIRDPTPGRSLSNVRERRARPASPSRATTHTARRSARAKTASFNHERRNQGIVSCFFARFTAHAHCCKPIAHALSRCTPIRISL